MSRTCSGRTERLLAAAALLLAAGAAQACRFVQALNANNDTAFAPLRPELAAALRKARAD